ncbi:hypothetical protein DINM_001275 [Dirofilaria immitis]|nr:hypothetical protein [Dirofilaria immitis]
MKATSSKTFFVVQSRPDERNDSKNYRLPEVSGLRGKRRVFGDRGEPEESFSEVEGNMNCMAIKNSRNERTEGNSDTRKIRKQTFLSDTAGDEIKLNGEMEVESAMKAIMRKKPGILDQQEIHSFRLKSISPPPSTLSSNNPVKLLKTAKERS